MTLVLGIGNVLMGDEGVGAHAATRLAGESWPADVTWIDGGTGGFSLLSLLQEHDPVIIVDATLDGRPAGTVSVLRPKYASDFPRTLTAHDIGLKDLIDAAAIVAGGLPVVHLVTVSITEIRSMELRMSPAVAAAIPEVGRRVRALLAETARHVCMNSALLTASSTS
jgi:hydrogenase maturation protease